ncbi:hypothetical protein TNCT_727711 [Trichonephila clavata]|uniref:Uncharacterized protein n=1 Tax=Trichonephila clavata TaxID=2740835 RepID=A0A8X6G565_TRICU|nr:hypothetical protein TNCT_727711 [Trichonephila clavata]
MYKIHQICRPYLPLGGTTGPTYKIFKHKPMGNRNKGQPKLQQLDTFNADFQIREYRNTEITDDKNCLEKSSGEAPPGAVKTKMIIFCTDMKML